MLALKETSKTVNLPSKRATTKRDFLHIQKGEKIINKKKSLEKFASYF